MCIRDRLGGEADPGGVLGLVGAELLQSVLESGVLRLQGQFKLAVALQYWLLFTN